MAADYYFFIYYTRTKVVCKMQIINAISQILILSEINIYMLLFIYLPFIYFGHYKRTLHNHNTFTLL